jgi:hypothetical protein
MSEPLIAPKPPAASGASATPAQPATAPAAGANPFLPGRSPAPIEYLFKSFGPPATTSRSSDAK